MRRADHLPDVGRLLAVVAHPDDETFGLGGIIATLVDTSAQVDVLCFTHGEASTLGRHDGEDLGVTRGRELTAAGRVLGVGQTQLLDWPDGQLADQPVAELAVPVAAMARETGADALLAFDESGITGHPDHRHATEAAHTVAHAMRLPLYAWAIPEPLAARLSAEFDTAFAGRPPNELDLAVPSNRARQRRAIACHVSQATDNPVLWRRLELAGDTDHLRLLS